MKKLLMIAKMNFWSSRQEICLMRNQSQNFALWCVILTDRTIHVLFLFVSTCLCESDLSTLLEMNTKHWKLNMICFCALSSTLQHISELMKKKQSRVSHSLDNDVDEIRIKIIGSFSGFVLFGWLGFMANQPLQVIWC